MSLITPSNLQYIVNLSILSRVIVLAIQLISNDLIDDHLADAYRNRYHQAISNATKDSTLDALPSFYWYSYQTIRGLTKWDAQYFLEISNDGYVSEQHLAFLPLFPVSVSFIKQLIFERTNIQLSSFFPPTKLSDQDPVISMIDLENYIRSAVVGCALNNFLFFPIASISLFALTKLVKKRDERYAKGVIWWFCFNPASIFFSACYTESLFAALTFTALFVIEYKSDNYLQNHEDIQDLKLKKKENAFTPLSQLNRLLYICLPSLALLALSSATRSNGIITVGFLGYQFILKYAPFTQIDRGSWSIMVYISVFLELVQDGLVMIMSAVIAASGYITFQVYSYIKFCLQDKSYEKGTLLLKPSWCDNSIPHPYGRVQAKFWNVGLFKYYEYKQLPNFILALPMSYLVLVGSLNKSKHLTKTRHSRRQLVYYLQGIMLTIFCGLTVNVQVTTRLLASSCPVVYWITADTAEQSRMKSRALITYFFTYFILGSVLHSNFFPWT